MRLRHEHFPHPMEVMASVWAARLEEGLAPDDRAALEAWLSEDEDRRRCLAQYRRFSAELDGALPALVGAGIVAMPDIRPARRTAWRRPFWTALGAAAACAAAAAVWTSSQVRAVSTHAEGRKTLTLADGSRAELNAHTDLVVEIGAKSRRIRLTNGEAVFSVVHNAACPFIVETPGGTVVDAGTVFNVRTDASGRLEVTVLEGSVSVNPSSPAPGADTKVSLVAGQQYSRNARLRQVKSLAAAAVADVVAWRDGGVVFTGMPLNAALARVGDFNDVRVAVAPEVANLRLGGRFRVEDLDGFLAALEAALPVRVTREPDGSVRVDGRSADGN